jgi:hypothetical protein
LVGSGLTANIRLSWRGLPGINARTYYENSKLTAVKSLILLTPERQSYKKIKSKLDCPLRAVSGKRCVFEPTQVEQLIVTYPNVRQG